MGMRRPAIPALAAASIFVCFAILAVAQESPPRSPLDTCRESILPSAAQLLVQLNGLLERPQSATDGDWNGAIVRADQISESAWQIGPEARARWCASASQADFDAYVAVMEVLAGADAMCMAARTGEGQYLRLADEHLTASRRAAEKATPVLQQAPPEPRPEVQPAAPQQSASSDTVYITKSGRKYHREGCRFLSKSQTPIGRREAESQGYTPCSVCQP